MTDQNQNDTADSENSEFITSLEELQAKPDRHYAHIPVPQWDGQKICLQTLTGSEQEEFEDKFIDENGEIREGVKQYVAAQCLVHPETRERLCEGSHQRGTLRDLPGGVLTLIWRWFAKNHGYQGELESEFVGN